MAPLRILHAHSTFALGGKEARAVGLMNVWGARARHTILSATADFGAAAAIEPGVRVEFPTDAPSLAGKPSPGRYRLLARYMRQFDLVLTYNWGAMDVVMARRMFAPVRRLPPLIHHEDGFNADEVVRQNARRVWFRRLGLGAADAVVVPSRRLETIAREVWWQPAARVRRIANGIGVTRYAVLPRADAIPGFAPDPAWVTVGTLAGLRGVKNLPRLVRAVAKGGDKVRLVIVGEGPERGAIEAEAARCGIADRVLLPGFLPDPARYVGLFDIFALSSDSEQYPISLVEAMAAGRPAACTDVGDVASIVAKANRPFVVPCDDASLAQAIAALARDPPLRAQIGEANRMRAAADNDEASMIAAYARLYADAAGTPGALG